MNTTFAGTDIVEYSTASEMAEKYQTAVQRIRFAHALIEQEREALRNAFAAGRQSYEFDLHVTYGHHSNAISDLDKIIDQMKKKAWASIIDKIGVRQIMSSKQVEDLNNYLYDRRSYNRYSDEKPFEMPDITAENIMGVIAGYHQAAPDLLLEMIREEYDFWKCHRESEYKRNSFEKLTPRIIRTGMISSGYGKQPFHVSYYDRGQHVTALDNIFHLLDGAGPVRGHAGPLADAINTSPDGTGETEYFRFRCYKNHNLHLDFKRLDLLKKFNELAGRAWLGHTKANA